MDQEPLASILRPQTLDDMVWQTKLVWPNWSIRAFLANGKIPSMIFWGTPGCGKTTLAHIIANTIQADFHALSGVNSKKEDFKEILTRSQNNLFSKWPLLIFLDEIHRWNKAQQDSVLPYVESWQVILIWATTENPSFTVNNALLSRCKVFVFEKITEEQIKDFFVKNMDKITEKYPGISIDEENLLLIWNMANWDLRNGINILESVIMIKKSWKIEKQDIQNAFEKNIYYDRNGEEHYNIISAIHKCLRDSDADAACYRVQRMLSAWEDPLYIARRLLRFASEDIGLANNNALLLANQVYDAVSKIWMPESDVFLFQLTIYLAKSKKDNTAYKVSLATREDVQKYWNLPVPRVIRNAPTKLMEELWYGKNYVYAPDHKGEKINNQHFPDKLKNRKYGIE